MKINIIDRQDSIICTMTSPYFSLVANYSAGKS